MSTRLIGIFTVLAVTGCLDDNGYEVGGVEDGPTAYALALADAARNPQVTNSVGMALVLVAPGALVVGSPQDEIGRDDNEEQRDVRVPAPFYLGTTEVTQAQWAAVMGKPYKTRFEGDNLPVDSVSLEDARAFVRALSEKEGRSYRLPSEAEWEYACRAGTTTPWSFGGHLGPARANTRFAGQEGGAALSGSREATAPVASYPPNGWGLHDMHGNVWEWTDDAILRGGAWNFSPDAARSAARMELDAAVHYDCIGFRVALDIAP